MKLKTLLYLFIFCILQTSAFADESFLIQTLCIKITESSAKLLQIGPDTSVEMICDEVKASDKITFICHFSLVVKDGQKATLIMENDEVSYTFTFLTNAREDSFHLEVFGTSNPFCIDLPIPQDEVILLSQTEEDDIFLYFISFKNYLSLKTP